jgi:hypothetical protein
MANDKQEVGKVRVEERYFNDGRIERKIGDGEWEEVSNPHGYRIFDGWWASNIELLTREEVEKRYPSKESK